MAADTSFFDATLAQLSQLAIQRSLATDTTVPEGSRYPPQHFDFKMPAIRTSTLPSEEREDYFSLTFKTLKAPVRKFTLHTSSVRTVAQVKRHLSRVSNIPVSTMRLVLNGKGLVDGKLIGDYAIQKSSVVQIISKPAGATPSPVPEAEEMAVVEDSNPLLHALSHKEKNIALEQKAKEVQRSGYASDATSDGESHVEINSATKEQLQQKNSSFRNNLRKLIHDQFGNTQAGAVDRLLDNYFASI
ncbi:hypothetical protein IWW36_001224 [Coemansia brasiliensis]|uniref:Ubiquitin-like domain-containing protein n=1 Tax=Coemansia brasiliensis TaxID=2650707 RepID=A0A9W8IA10_9FUNG|nr:hypothetical protein IWW36_001224 [Coemansia brasiliensis]